MKKLIILILLLFSMPVLAQGIRVTEVSNSFLTAEFFAAVFAGLVLALAFQMILTNLTAAAGLSAAKAVTDKSGDKNSSSSSDSKKEKKSDKVYSTLRKVNAGFGLWTIITASISLFFASWLAVAFTGTAFLGMTFGIVTGLVIWGLSYLITITLELSAGSSMIGALVGITKNGLQQIKETSSSMFSSSETKQHAKTAEAITDAVRSELVGQVDLKKEINNYIDQLQPDYTPRDFRKELQSLLDNLEIRAFIEDSDRANAEIVQEISTDTGTISREQAKSTASSIRDAVQKAGEEKDKDKRQADQMADAAMRTGGMSAEEAEETRKKVEEYLVNTDKEELHPEGIKQDLEQMFHDPKGGARSLKQRVSQIDRNTMVAALEQRENMSQKDAEKRVDQVMQVINKVSRNSEETSASAQSTSGDTQAKMKSAAVSKKQQALSGIENYMQSLDTESPKLDPEVVRYEVELLFHDPKTGADALYHRAKNLNRDEVMALVSGNRHISREDAEQITDQIMEARDRVVEKAQEMRREVENRLEQAKEEVLHQADQTRKTIASAAWWVFASALISGIAAGLGGWIGTIV